MSALRHSQPQRALISFVILWNVEIPLIFPKCIWFYFSKSWNDKFLKLQVTFNFSYYHLHSWGDGSIPQLLCQTRCLPGVSASLLFPLLSRASPLWAPKSGEIFLTGWGTSARSDDLVTLPEIKRNIGFLKFQSTIFWGTSKIFTVLSILVFTVYIGSRRKISKERKTTFVWLLPSGYVSII